MALTLAEAAKLSNDVLLTGVVELKAKAVRTLFEQTFITGDSVANTTSFDGVDKLVDPTQSISMGTNGASLTLDKLDELIDTVKGGKPELLLMTRRSRRIVNKLARTSGAFLETDRDEFGQMLAFYDGIPIGVSDYISDAQTVGTSTIKRGIIKSYDGGTHKASVQIAGSLAVWLDGVPVATDIPATEVVAGRDCGVLFFTDDNPDDAVVVTVHGAVPSPVLAGSYIADNDGNTSVHTETMPNEDRIRMLIAGVLRYMMAEASPHHDLTGDLRLSGVLAVKGATPDVTQAAYIIARDAAAPDGQIAILADVGGLTSVGTGAVTGVGGRALARNAATVTAYGLDYLAGANGQSLVDAAAVRAQIIFLTAIGKTITNATCIQVRAPLNLGGTITNVYGVRVEAITIGGNRRPIQEEGRSE